MSRDVTAGELEAYRAGTLPEPAAERVRDALVADPALADALLALANGRDVEAAAGDVEPAEIDAQWRAFEARLPPAPSARVLPFRTWVARRPLSSVAASFAIAVVATWFFARVVLPGPPSAGVAGELVYEELEAEGAREILRGGLPAVELPGAEGSLVLNLVPPPVLDLPRPLPEVCTYELRRSGGPLATGRVRRQDEGFYVLQIATRDLPTGEYEVLLLDPEAAAAEPLLTYRFRLE